LPLSAIPDVRTSIRRAAIDNYVLPPLELRSIAILLAECKSTGQFFARRKERYPLLQQLVRGIEVDKILEFNINGAIDEDGAVRDSASRQLKEIRHELVEKNSSLRKRLQSILKNVAEKEWIQDEIITTRDGRMVIPVKSEHKNRVPGLIHSSSSSGVTVFIEPTETLELNNDIRTLQFQELREIERILKELTAQVAHSGELLLRDFQMLTRLDCLQAKARHSIQLIGNEPHIEEGRTTKLIQAYHPLLLEKHARSEVVPLTIELPPEIRTVIITGPNAGGKSVAMKTIGLLSLLAQSGCHIPASAESELSLITDLFVEMGDDQSIEQDLSSFSSHLSHLKHIFEHVNSSSLVLIDEIGSGTDPLEGGALAAAALKYLASTDCQTIVTTHHGSLKALAYDHPRFENASMEFNQKTLTPTYRLQVGIPGSSYAIEMAERLHLPEIIVEESRELRGAESQKLETILADLQVRSQQLQDNLDGAAQEKHNFERLKTTYEEKLKSFELERKQIKLKAINEASELIDDARRHIEIAIRTAREGNNGHDGVREARQVVTSVAEKVAAQRTEVDPPLEWESKVGMSVRLKDSTETGEIVEFLEDGTAIVLVGALKIRVSKKDLLPAEQLRRVAGASEQFDYGTPVTTEIDLRGMYGEEAIAAMEKLFDQAILNGLNKVTLIHGKGTGALRRKITDYLKESPAVKAYRLGEWNEGGTGVTVVELR
jgi:DNA mismatch repair protein MutS2